MNEAKSITPELEEVVNGAIDDIRKKRRSIKFVGEFGIRATKSPYVSKKSRARNKMRKKTQRNMRQKNKK